MISIIIPTYNASKYIEKCLDSILNQSYKDLEVIIINDGSTDSTELICSKYLKYKNFELISKENEGPGAARQVGLAHASGDYISFVDSDDYIDKDFYKTIMKEFETQNVDIVECGYKFVNEDGAVIQNSKMIREIVVENCTKHYVLKKNTTNYLCNKIFKKELFSHIEFPKLYAGEDSCVLLQLFSNAKSISVIPNNMYNYVQTSASLCRKPYNLKKNDSVKAGIFMYNYCVSQKNNLENYYASYICMNAAICYSELKFSNIENKEEYMQDMKNVFLQYFQYKNIKTLDISLYRKILLLMFKITPSMTSFVYKRVLKK